VRLVGDSGMAESADGGKHRDGNRREDKVEWRLEILFPLGKGPDSSMMFKWGKTQVAPRSEGGRVAD